MDLARPEWLWLLLAAPAVAGLAAWCWWRRLRAAALWASRGLWNRVFPSHAPRRMTASVVFLGLGIAGVALALSQPRWGTSTQQVERRGVDLVFVLDTSLSMATRDVMPSRLWVGQTLIRSLVQALPGNRVALVQAEGDGVVMVPLTLDAAVIDLLLDAVQAGSLPTPGTKLAAALNKALALFPEGAEKHRVLVLVSDGEDHGSDLQQIAGRLSDSGTVLHAIGIGTPEGKPLELPPSKAGGPLEYKRDEAGKVVVSRLEETNLESLTRATGGLYLRATNAAANAEPIASRILDMERRRFSAETINALEERYQWPIGLSIVALCLFLLLSPFAGDPR